jgi:competence protein ComEC
VGVRAEAGLLLGGKGEDAFVRDAWLAYYGEADPGRLPYCDGACKLPVRGGRAGAVLVLPGAAAPCEAGVLISTAPIRGACRQVRVIDRFTVYREGAQAIWLRPAGVEVLSDRAYRGQWPWVVMPAGR